MLVIVYVDEFITAEVILLKSVISDKELKGIFAMYSIDALPPTAVILKEIK